MWIFCCKKEINFVTNLVCFDKFYLCVELYCFVLGGMNMYKLNLQCWNKEKSVNVVFAIVGFLMGRVVLFGGINGFAIGYLTCFLFGKNLFYAIAMAIFTGLVSIRRTMDTGGYVIALFLMCLFNFLGKGRIQNNKKYLIGGLSLLSGELMIAGFTGNFVYYCIIGTLETVFTVVLAYVLDKGIGVLESNGRKKYIDGEEMLSLFILGTAVICGSGNLSFLGVPPVMVAVVTVIFISAAKGGCMLAIACGACMGMMLSFTNIYPTGIVATLAIGGLTAAMAGRFRRIFMPIGFVLSFAPMVIYYRMDLLSVGVFVAVVLAGIINMYIPDRLYLNFSNVINTGISQSNMYNSQIKNIVCEKLKKFSRCFADLDIYIQTASVSQETENMKFEIFDRCTSNVCGRCSRQGTCWEGNYKTTYDNLYGLVSKWVDNGNVDFKNLPNYFIASCAKYREWLLWAKNSIDENKFKNLCMAQKEEYRQLLSMYAKNVAQRTESIVTEIENETNVDLELSDKIYRKTAYMGVRGITVSRGEKGCILRILLSKDDSWDLCGGRIMPILKDLLGVNLIKSEEQSVDSGNCSITLIQEPVLRISAYCCSKPKDNENICGDSFIFTDLENGKYLLALADGMGSGKNAGKESAAAVEMYEDFTEAGFFRDDALEIINSLVSGKDESFSTLDICTVDKYTGKAEFIKVGAVATFILRKKSVEILKSNTLPVGILENVDTKIYEKKIEKGDVIIMMTDGIFEAGKSGENEEKFIELLKKREKTTAENTAKKIMETALELGKNKIHDDMTVLVANIY